MVMANTYIPAPPVPRTLIADDQPDVATALRLLLRDAGHQTEAVTSPAAALEAIKERNFDLVLMDLNYARDTTSGQEGLDLITSIRQLDSTLPLVVLTGWGTVELASKRCSGEFTTSCKSPGTIATDQDSPKAYRTGPLASQTDRYDAQNQQVHEHLDQELADAEEIQRALLPKALPHIECLDIAVAWRPARAVGGDYFDVLKFAEHRAGICIADVAGKGMPAALLMSNAQAFLKSLAADTLDPGELCTRVNKVVCENIVPNRFISCFYALLDTRTKTLSYSNAGHYAPMLIRAGLASSDGGGPVLGFSRITPMRARD